MPRTTAGVPPAVELMVHAQQPNWCVPCHSPSRSAPGCS